MFIVSWLVNEHDISRGETNISRDKLAAREVCVSRLQGSSWNSIRCAFLAGLCSFATRSISQPSCSSRLKVSASRFSRWHSLSPLNGYRSTLRYFIPPSRLSVARHDPALCHSRRIVQPCCNLTVASFVTSEGA